MLHTYLNGKQFENEYFMSQKNYLEHNCPIAQSMAVLGGQWTLLIARDLMNGINKFDNIQKSLKISRNLLTQRLQQMESNGLAQKVVPDGLKRSIYKPTQKCFDLTNTLLALSEWSEKWIPDPNGPSHRQSNSDQMDEKDQSQKNKRPIKKERIEAALIEINAHDYYQKKNPMVSLTIY